MGIMGKTIVNPVTFKGIDCHLVYSNSAYQNARASALNLAGWRKQQQIT
jgi:hypothetical protein